MSNSATVDYDALAQQAGAIQASAQSVDYDALAQQHGAAIAQPATSISARPEPHGLFPNIERWADNVTSDIKYGTDLTGIGTVLKKMGAHGVYNGNPEAVGDFMASLPLGLVRVIKGQSETAQPGKVWRGTKDIVEGSMQAATMPAGFIAPEAGEAAAEFAASAKPMATKVGQSAIPVSKTAGRLADVATFERGSKAWAAIQKGLSELREIWGKKPTFPGAPFPETPSKEWLQAGALEKGPAQATEPPAAALGKIRAPESPAPAPAAAPAPTSAESTVTEAVSSPALRGEFVKTDLAGDQVLRKVLTGQDNKNLLQIARSRGIDVTKEAQLKPGIADSQLVNKIIDNFSDDELANVKATHQEVTRNMHNFGEIGPEAWKTMGLKTYFPDLKIPQSVLNRTSKVIGENLGSPSRPVEFLDGHQGFKQGGEWFMKGGNFPADKWTRVSDPNTKNLLDAVSSKAPKATASTDDLTGILEDSLKKARSQKTAP